MAPSIDISISSGTDDAEEKLSSGAVKLNSNELKLGQSGGAAQIVGMRFTNVDIPKGAIITNAFIQFETEDPNTSAALLTFYGEASANAAQFASTARSISSRTKTDAAVLWTPQGWDAGGEAGADQRSPDLSSIVQEIIDQADWARLNSLVFLVTGAGERHAEAVEGRATAAPKLHVEYVLDPVASVAAIADAGEPGTSGAFVVSLTRAAATDTTLGYTVTGSATANGDYQTLAGTVTIPAGQLSANIAVNVLDDQLAEGNETVTIKLSSVISGADNIKLDSNSASLTIVDDEVPVVLSVSSLRSFVNEGAVAAIGGEGDAAEPDTDGLFVARLSKVSGTNTVIGYTISGSATPNADYEALTGTIVIPAGALSADIPVHVIDDLIFEDSETVVVYLNASVISGDPEIIVDTTPASVTIADNDQPTIFERRVSSSNDDAEERISSGSVTLTDGNLELGQTGSKAQIVGLRFNLVDVPQGAIVTNAYIQFRSDKATSTNALITFRGEDADNAAPFVKVNNNISNRSLTDASVDWAAAAWTGSKQAGPDQMTADLSSIIQEIVARPGWEANNSLVITATGVGPRVAQSFKKGAAFAPNLHVEYVLGNGAPSAADSSVSTNEDVAVSGVLPSAMDPDGNSISYALATQAAHGAAVVHANGTYDYTPATNFNGSDSFEYKVVDQYGASNTYQVDVNVNPINDAPIAGNLNISGDPGTVLTGTLPIATDPEGNQFTYALKNQAGHGTATVSANGNYTYTPNTGYEDGDSFMYVVTDSHGASSEYTVNVDLTSEFSFWVIGDTPYNDHARQALPQILSTPLPEVDFVFHVGDIQPGSSTSPALGVYTGVADMLLQSPVPVFVVVGDNEYQDTSNPTLAIANWRSVFLQFDQNWNHDIQVNWQGGENENFSFVYKQTLFISFNFDDDNVTWLQDNFALYGDQVTNAVTISQAKVEDSGYYGDLVNTYVALAQDFGKPILHAMGDKHFWSLSNPFAAAPNVTRVIVERTAYGAGHSYDPLLVTVSDDNPNMYTFDHDFV
jgi:VCBS repeat-containing protein